MSTHVTLTDYWAVPDTRHKNLPPAFPTRLGWNSLFQFISTWGMLLCNYFYLGSTFQVMLRCWSCELYSFSWLDVKLEKQPPNRDTSSAVILRLDELFELLCVSFLFQTLLQTLLCEWFIYCGASPNENCRFLNLSRLQLNPVVYIVHARIHKRYIIFFFFQTKLFLFLGQLGSPKLFLFF